MAIDISKALARSIVMSLSDGIVPREGAALFSAGRERWLASLGEDLDDLASEDTSDGRIRIFVGRNGDGKTHLMHLLRQQAFDNGFAVSYVVISGSTPLYRSDRIYAEIGKTVSTASSGARVGLRAILDPESPDPLVAEGYQNKAISIRRVPGINPRFASVVYRYCTRQTVNVDQEQDMLLLGAWLEGGPDALGGLGVHGNIDATNGNSMLHSLVLTLRHFGLRGLVVLIDEVESVLSLKVQLRRQSYQTLRLLIDRENTPAHSLLVASMTPPMFTDPDKGIQTYPALWSRLRPATNTPHVNYYGTLVDLTRTPLRVGDFLSIGMRIREIHHIARDWTASDRVTDAFLESAADVAASGRLTLVYSPTRVFVKLVTETLELAHQHPEFMPDAETLDQKFGEIDDKLQQAEQTHE